MTAPETPVPSSGKPVRALIIDDHPIVRDGLRFSLGKMPGFIVCGEADNAEDAAPLAVQFKPELVIIDLVMGGRDCGDAVARMRELLPDAAILVFSMNPEELFAERVLKSGANGYLMKTDGFEKLHQAVHTVLSGSIYLSEYMVSHILSTSGSLNENRDLSSLTDREMQVFLRIGEGKTTGEIAEELNLSGKTVATHRENMKTKLGFTNSTKLAHRAISWVLGQGRNKKDSQQES